MKKLTSLVLMAATVAPQLLAQEQLPTRAEILRTAETTAAWFMDKYDAAAPFLGTGKVRETSLWTRAVLHEGLMALYSIDSRDEYYDYSVTMADANLWGPRHGMTTLDADNYACFQTYIDLYRLEPASYKLRKVIAKTDVLVNNPDCSDWWWIDALQMGMPVMAKLGKTTGETKYWDKMWDMYEYTRNKYDETGMWNPTDGLWWRDHDFNPPYKTKNGCNCYWSRGNGWVIAALKRVMDELPEPTAPATKGAKVNDPYHYNDYLADFKAMCKALKGVQREDGFWNCDLGDPDNFGGKETSGTVLFVYGMAWGIRKGYLPADEYLPVVTKAWNAVMRDAWQQDGWVGYIQGTGKEPKDSQPVTLRGRIDFEDFGIGCFLLAATEVYKLSPGEQGVGAQRLKMAKEKAKAKK